MLLFKIMGNEAMPEGLSKEVSDITPSTQEITSSEFIIPKGLLIGMVLVLLVSFSTIGFLVYQNFQLRKQIQQIQVTSTPSPTLIPSPEIKPLPTTTSVWETYLSEKVVDYFEAFRLYYPDSWEMIIEKGEDPARQSLALEKDNFIIQILQAPGSEASCLYPEDPSLEGMFARYGEYKEIDKSNGIVWRRAATESQPPNKIFYMVCERKLESEYFTGATSIGVVSLRGQNSDTQILDEFDEILKRIEILE